jgi:hypothetical protein
MLAERSAEIASLAGASAVAACWAQWVALGSPASGQRLAATAIVDPEALIVLSLSVQNRERRLRDLVAWWARSGSGLTSVQRFRSVAAQFPRDSGEQAMGWFAARAAGAGERRWSRHATAGGDAPAARDKGPDEPSLAESAALLLRLRAGFGVGAKADTLAFLLGTEGAWASTKVIAFATGYSSVAIRSAVSEMALARFIRVTSDGPAEYSISGDAWARLLGLSDAGALPRWRFWSDIFAFLAGALAWTDAARAPGAPGAHVLASRARDLVDKHARAFDLGRIPVRPPGERLGLEAINALCETVRLVAQWIEAEI